MTILYGGGLASFPLNIPSGLVTKAPFFFFFFNTDKGQLFDFFINSFSKWPLINTDQPVEVSEDTGNFYSITNNPKAIG